eukprot:g4648.t1
MRNLLNELQDVKEDFDRKVAIEVEAAVEEEKKRGRVKLKAREAEMQRQVHSLEVSLRSKGEGKAEIADLTALLAEERTRGTRLLAELQTAQLRAQHV